VATLGVTPLVVIRSTVNPGDCMRWWLAHEADILYQPEYLGETVQHPFADIKARPFLVIGAMRKIGVD